MLWLLVLVLFAIAPITRRELLTKTLLVEGALVLFTLLLDGAGRLYAWWMDVAPPPASFSQFQLDWMAVGLGALAALPPLVLLFLIDLFPLGPLRKIKEISELFLRPILRNTRWPDYFLLSAMAGFCEELFFRGWMQPFVEQWLPFWAGNLVVGFVFACCHAITPAYFLIAWLISLYFGWLLHYSGNLLTPMTAHAVYDLIALFAVMSSQTTDHEPGMDSQPASTIEDLPPESELLADSRAAVAVDAEAQTEKDGLPGGEKPVPFVQGEGRREEGEGEQAEEL